MAVFSLLRSSTLTSVIMILMFSNQEKNVDYHLFVFSRFLSQLIFNLFVD